MKPICLPCQRFFRPERNGYRFIEGRPKDNSAYPGTTEPEMWEPYKLWVGDLWSCHGCGAMIVVGVAHSPLSEHYLPNFKTALDASGGARLVQINDC